MEIRRKAVLVLAVAGLLSPARAQEPLAVSMTILSATVEGPFVRGVMEIAAVNHTDETLGGLRLVLEQPNSGALGEDGVDIGDVPMDGTGRASAPFVLDARFMSAEEPYLLRATYRNAAGEDVEVWIGVSRQNGGGR